MHRLIKTINKFNGNFCFVGGTENYDIIFECDRYTQALSSQNATKWITDVCTQNLSSYLVAFSDEYLGQYSGGVLDETYIATGLSSVDKITSDINGNIYILNRTDNQLVKYNAGVIWTFDLPDYGLRADGQIILRESDGNIVYYNNTNLHVVRDDTTKGTLLNSLEISSSGNLKALISGEFNVSYSYVRARMVTGRELDQSSSSSFSSSSSSSVDSSSSSSSSLD